MLKRAPTHLLATVAITRSNRPVDHSAQWEWEMDVGLTGDATGRLLVVHVSRTCFATLRGRLHPLLIRPFPPPDLSHRSRAVAQSYLHSNPSNARHNSEDLMDCGTLCSTQHHSPSPFFRAPCQIYLPAVAPICL